MDGEWICLTCAQLMLVEVPNAQVLGTAPVLSLLPFEQPAVRALLHCLKYEGIAEAAPALVRACAARPGSRDLLLQGLDPFGKGLLLIPVPSAKITKRARGYAQAELLAQELGTWLDAPVWPGALFRSKGGTQVGHSASRRKERVSDLFSWSGSDRLAAYENRTWVVVDDVLTTGATLSACLELVSLHGGAAHAGLTLAWKR